MFVLSTTSCFKFKYGINICIYDMKISRLVLLFYFLCAFRLQIVYLGYGVSNAVVTQHKVRVAND